jgi:hypothetical protein
LIIPPKIKVIHDNTFTDCQFDGVLILNDGLKHIGKGAFTITRFSGKLIIPETVEIIDLDAFSGTEFTSIVLPKKLKYLGDYAFAESNIEGHVSIPRNLDYLGANVFKNSRITSCDYMLKELPCKTFNMCSNLIVNIPDGVEVIGRQAFNGCNFPINLVIPKSVRIIESGAFNSCGVIEHLTIFPTIHYIAANAFGGCQIENLYLENEQYSAHLKHRIKNIYIKRVSGTFLFKFNCIITDEINEKFILKTISEYFAPELTFNTKRTLNTIREDNDEEEKENEDFLPEKVIYI